MKKEWYVVNTVSGYEYKVKEKLDMMINSMQLQENIYRVVVPEHKVTEVKDGQTKERVKKMFPGYVLVEMVMSDEAWYIVRNTQGVTGFIGSSGKGAKPIPLLPEEVDKILGNMGISKYDIDKDLVPGRKVNIVNGPFANSNLVGVIESVDIENSKVSLTVDLFGQETSIEVNLSDIECL